MTVQRANEQAFQEFQRDYDAELQNKDSKYFFSNKRGKGEKDLSTTAKMFLLIKSL